MRRWTRAYDKISIVIISVNEYRIYFFTYDTLILIRIFCRNLFCDSRFSKTNQIKYCAIRNCLGV